MRSVSEPIGDYDTIRIALRLAARLEGNKGAFQEKARRLSVRLQILQTISKRLDLRFRKVASADKMLDYGEDISDSEHWRTARAVTMLKAPILVRPCVLVIVEMQSGDRAVFGVRGQ